MTYSWYRNRQQEFDQFFEEENSVTFCPNVPGLMNKLGVDYKADDWRFFLDGSSKNIKAVLLHNQNVLPSVPIAYTSSMKESHQSVALIVKSIRYFDHNWLTVVDLKVLSMLLGQQLGYTKYSCYMCLFDTRAEREERWTCKHWPTRTDRTTGRYNIVGEALIPEQHVILPPLHLKLGCMSQFVKALPEDGETIKYLVNKFPALSGVKIKAGVFTGPQIRKLISDSQFARVMKTKERTAWNSFIAAKQRPSLQDNCTKDANYFQGPWL